MGCLTHLNNMHSNTERRGKAVMATIITERRDEAAENTLANRRAEAAEMENTLSIRRAEATKID